MGRMEKLIDYFLVFILPVVQTIINSKMPCSRLATLPYLRYDLETRNRSTLISSDGLLKD